MPEKNKDKIKLAFHIHSSASKDSLMKPKKIVEYCRKRGIGAIAICDHNSITGALETREVAAGNPIVIIGQEISSLQGEIIALFLEQKIERGLPLRETINQIRKYGGLVCLPHPGERLRRSAIRKKDAARIAPEVDVIEVYNSRTLLKTDNEWAEELAVKNSKPQIIGSDSHSLSEINHALILMEPFEGQKDFINSLAGADLSHRRKADATKHMSSIFIRAYKKARGKA